MSSAVARSQMSPSVPLQDEFSWLTSGLVERDRMIDWCRGVVLHRDYHYPTRGDLSDRFNRLVVEDVLGAAQQDFLLNFRVDVLLDIGLLTLRRRDHDLLARVYALTLSRKHAPMLSASISSRVVR